MVFIRGTSRSSAICRTARSTAASGSAASSWQRTEFGASALVLQPDGKLVAAGDGALVRFTPDGSLDSSFGKAGVLTTAVGAGATANALLLQPDGRLVTAGYSQDKRTVKVFALARDNANGTLDSRFGVGGKVTTAIGSGIGGLVSADALVIQPDGKLVAAGSSATGSFANGAHNYHFALRPLQRERQPRPELRFGWKVQTSIGSDAFGSALAIQPDGNLAAAGSTSTKGHSQVALARYNPDGSLDRELSGSRGKVQTSIRSECPRRRARDPAGRQTRRRRRKHRLAGHVHARPLPTVGSRLAGFSLPLRLFRRSCRSSTISRHAVALPAEGDIASAPFLLAEVVVDRARLGSIYDEASHARTRSQAHRRAGS